jgi:hypothetical protein
MEKIMIRLIYEEMSTSPNNTGAAWRTAAPTSVSERLLHYKLAKDALKKICIPWAIKMNEASPEKELYIERLGNDATHIINTIGHLHNSLLNNFIHKNYTNVVKLGRQIHHEFIDLRAAIKEFFNFAEQIIPPNLSNEK